VRICKFYFVSKTLKVFLYIYSSNQNFKDLGRLLNYFQTNSGEKLGTEVNLAKAMFVQNGYNLTKPFLKAAEDYLNTKLVTVNFKSEGEHTRHIINQYDMNHIL